MRELFDTLIRRALLPHVEQLAYVSDELNELHRRLSNMIRIGTVVAVNPEAGRCQVQHGECRSPWVRYFMPAAGAVSQARHPSEKEQCLLLNYGGGDTSAQSMALCGLPYSEFPPVSVKAEISATAYPDGLRIEHDSLNKVTKTRYSDGAVQQYDAAQQRMTCRVASSSIEMDSSAITLTAGGATLRIEAAGIAMTGGKVTHDDKPIGKDHIHPNVQQGSAKTGPPEG